MEAEEDLPHHFLQHEEGDEIVEYVDDRGHPIDGMEEFVEWVPATDEEKPFEHHVHHEEVYQGEEEVYMQDEEGHYYEQYQEHHGYEEHQQEEDIPYEDLHPESYGDYDDAAATTSYPGQQMGRQSAPRKLTIVECEVCGAILKHPSKIQAHMRTHTGEKPFVCHLCGDRFTQKVPLMNHIRRHTGDMPFECAFCGKKFPNNAQKNAHELRHQGVRRRGPPRPHLKPPKRRVLPVPAHLPDTVTVKRQIMDEEKGVMLEWQQQPPPTYSHLHQPLSAAASKRIDDVIEAVISGSDLLPKKEPPVHRSALIAQCNVCGLMLRHPSKIKAHMRTHTGERPFGCTVCGFRFANMYPLRMHMKRKHTAGERKVPCTEEHCAMLFVSVGAMNEHVRVAHRNNKRYTCGVPGCGRAFNRRTYLMTHRMKEHPNFQPVFDPHEVTAAEELDQQIDRAVHYPPDTMLIDGEDVDRLIELPDGVILLPEGAQILEGEFINDDGTEHEFDPSVHYLAEDVMQSDSGVGESHLEEAVLEEMDGDCKPGTFSDALAAVEEKPMLKAVKMEPKLEETVKHVWMNPDGGDNKRRISVRILKRR